MAQEAALQEEKAKDVKRFSEEASLVSRDFEVALGQEQKGTLFETMACIFERLFWCSLYGAITIGF